MARQCIYCGRLLEPGESCKCRSGPEPKATAGSQTGPGPKTGTGPTPKASSAKGRSWAKRPDWARYTKSSNGTTGTSRPGARRNPQANLSTGKLKELLRRYTGFLRAPIDTALDFADDPGIAGILLLVSIEAIAAAILAAVGSRSPVFYLTFTALGMTMQGAGSVWAAALLAAIQSFIRLGLLSGVFYAYMRFIVKRRVSYQAVAASTAPACAPMSVMLLVSSLSAVNATSLSTLTLVLGMMAGILLMFFTFRRLVGLSDNQTLLMLLFGHLLYYSVLSLLTGTMTLLY